VSRRGCLEALDRLRLDGALGALIAARDGVPVAFATDRPVSPEAFSAMVAALFGAAGAAAQEWGERRPVRAVIETDELRLLVEAVDADHVLAAVVPTAGANALAARMRDLAPRVARELLG